MAGHSLKKRKWLITGAAGFIGTHLARHLEQAGDSCILTDNFYRGMACPNVHFLDVRRPSDVEAFFESNGDIDAVAHLAGQVSLVASITNPRYDFETNAGGTFNVLEAMRRHTPRARLIFASTNKVYGDLGALAHEEHLTRYSIPDYPHGLTEKLPLELHGGYSCSKGAADQYVRDYHKVYGLKTVCLRQSSIYGGGQRATGDQGWLAWFVRMGVQASSFGISGTGKQVRDLLHVSDLCACFKRIADLPESSPVWGEAFNIGGGPVASLSILELFEILRRDFGLTLDYTAGPPRVGDQKVFIADTARARDCVGWEPRVHLAEGLEEIVTWSQARWPSAGKTALRARSVECDSGHSGPFTDESGKRRYPLLQRRG
jgi:CDP-paratose 2-epimerase